MAMNMHQWVIFQKQYAQKLNEARGQAVLSFLNQHDAVEASKEKLWLTHDVYNKFSSILPQLASWFLWREDRVGGETARKELEEYLHSDSIELSVCVWVFGIRLNTTSKFGEILLVPTENMPDSAERDSYLRLKAGFESPTAHAAFVKNIQVPRLIDDQKEASKIHKDYFHETLVKLYCVLNLMNAIDDLSCIPHWDCVYKRDALPLGPFWGTGKSRTDFDVIGKYTRELRQDHIDRFSKMYSLYIEFERDKKRSAWLQAILDRLRDSKRKRSLEGRILDLGIAAEMLLLRDLTDRDPVSFPFRFRGSWLLGMTFEERAKVHDLLKELYGFRSQVAHNGIFAKQKDATVAKEHLARYYALVEQIINKAITADFPQSTQDWLSLVLGKKIDSSASALDP